MGSSVSINSRVMISHMPTAESFTGQDKGGGGGF